MPVSSLPVSSLLLVSSLLPVLFVPGGSLGKFSKDFDGFPKGFWAEERVERRAMNLNRPLRAL